MRIRIIPAVLLVAACASAPQWEKEGVAIEAMQADLYTCHSQAPIEPRVQGPSGLPSGPGQAQGARLDAIADREAQRMAKDERFVAECMRGKGYSSK